MSVFDDGQSAPFEVKPFGYFKYRKEIHELTLTTFICRTLYKQFLLLTTSDIPLNYILEFVAKFKQSVENLAKIGITPTVIRTLLDM
jgi:hypothetical protein